MKQMFRIRIVCAGLLLAMAGALFASCAKKEGPARAAAIFVVGTVTVERAGAPARPLKLKEEVLPGDLVRTGADSLLALQLGAESVIKIDENTVLAIGGVMDEAGTRLSLERGRVFSRLRHLARGTDFRISTKTAIAAVRGTEFSVSYGRVGAVVAVSEGLVDVTQAAGGAMAGPAVAVGVGRAAVVNESVTTRPVTGEEKEAFDRFGQIRPVSDLDGASEPELRKRQDEYLEKAGWAGEGKDGSSPGGASADDAAKKALLWTGKGVYSSSDTIVVYYRDMPDYRNCWIDVSKASDSDGTYRSYNWTYGATGGKMEFAGLGLEPGVYEARAHFGRGNSVDKRFRFLVR